MAKPGPAQLAGRIALTPLGLAERSRRGRSKEPSQGSYRIVGRPPSGLLSEELYASFASRVIFAFSSFEMGQPALAALAACSNLA